MSPWRYNRNGRPSDPVDQPTLEGLLKAGTLPPDTLVWREGMSEWAKANLVPDLAAVITSPPAPTAVVVSARQDTGAPPIPPLRPEDPPLPPGGCPPGTAGFDADKDDIEKHRIFAVLAYLGILFLVPLLAAPKSRFARYHTNQGVVLFIANIVASVATVILFFVPLVGCAGGVLAVALPVTSLVFMILGIVNAASGLYKPLPLIGHYELMPIDPGA